MVKVKKKRRYDCVKARKTRQINKERKKMGLPTLAEEKKKKSRKYNYTMQYAGKGGLFREFKGKLGENAREWRKTSKYVHRVKVESQSNSEGEK